MRHVALALLWSTLPALAQTGSAPTDTVRERGMIIGIHAMVGLTPSAASYFDAYRSTLGGTVAAFPAQTGIAGTANVELSPDFSVLLQAQSFSLALDDAGSLQVNDTATGVPREVARSTDRWSVQTYPFLAGVRYIPFPSRFQSYVFAMAGFAVTHMRWDHVTVSAADRSQYPSAVYEATTVSPSLCFGAGLELVFDQFRYREVLRGISIDVRYRIAPSSARLFGSIADASSAPEAAWRESYPVSFGGFELSLGLLLQFFH